MKNLKELSRVECTLVCGGGVIFDLFEKIGQICGSLACSNGGNMNAVYDMHASQRGSKL